MLYSQANRERATDSRLMTRALCNADCLPIIVIIIIIIMVIIMIIMLHALTHHDDDQRVNKAEQNHDENDEGNILGPV